MPPSDPSPTARRVLLGEDARPFAGLDAGRTFDRRGRWPSRWVRGPAGDDADAVPAVVAFRLRVSLDAATTVRAHVSADERYELYLGGRIVGRGPERGDAVAWPFETYDLALPAGASVIVARVWALGELAPFAQMSLHDRGGRYPGPRWLFAPEGPSAGALGTGVAAWEAARLGGRSFVACGPPGFVGPGRSFVGPEERVDAAAYPWGWASGDDGAGDWRPAREGPEALDTRRPLDVAADDVPLSPATLPPQIDRAWPTATARHVEAFGRDGEGDAPPSVVDPARAIPGAADEWDRLLDGSAALRVGPGGRVRAIVDLGDYVCGRPEVTTSGGRGSTVAVRWAEALYVTPDPTRAKGDRDAIDGKHFHGFGDAFLPDGGDGRIFSTLWWRAGRYLEIVVTTGDEPLTIDHLGVRETRYPLEPQSTFESPDAGLATVVPVLLRGLQMCAHETYMDCPHFEQLQYAGDTRLEALATYAVGGDDRLARKAVRAFDQSRSPDGLTRSRHPSRETQTIPPFSLWWVGMVYDHARWRGDRAFVADRLRGVRAVLECFDGFAGEDGLIESPAGWNFVDWVPAWEGGIPPGGLDPTAGEARAVCGPVNWQYALALGYAAALEGWAGEAARAESFARQSAEHAARCAEAFFDPARGLLADDLGRRHFSEHSQCLALLAVEGVPAPVRDALARNLPSAEGVERATIYFSHYLLEALREIGRADAVFERLAFWKALPGQGFKTAPETPEPSRSDCHGWGSHPLYHLTATVLGVRPVSFGFASVEVRPMLGPLAWARGSIAHPRGRIEVNLRRGPDGVDGEVTLPPGVTGTFGDGATPLRPGRNAV